MSKVAVFDLCGPLAHFRKYYTNSSSLTYGFPPRTALMGVVAAVVGRERDAYYEDFAPGRASFAVVNLTPVRRLIQTVNYVRTKEEDLARLRGLGAARGTQVPLELLLPAGGHCALRFRVFFACADGAVVEEVAARLRDGRPYFPLYLGLTEFIAEAVPVALANPGDYEVVPPGGVVALDSVLNAEFLAEVVLGRNGQSGRRFVRERAPFAFGPGRTLAPPVDVIFEAEARPLTVRLRCPAYRFRLPDRTCTVAFMEGPLCATSPTRTTGDGTC
ncbi:MAG: CRISPR-associated protein Cas5 [Desulfotomaculales bacterium]